jgi:hypothetical protein
VKMADYFALIEKAVARLDASAPFEERRALYERARSALLAQLRTITPPLSEAEITRERLALEDAVRRVEAEARQSVDDHRVPVLSDLVVAAENIGKRSENRSTDARAMRSANPFSPPTTVQLTPPMTVRGGATGRLIEYWRWRSRSPREAAANLASGRVISS